MQGTTAASNAHGTGADSVTAAAKVEAEAACSAQTPSAPSSRLLWKQLAGVAEVMIALDPPGSSEYQIGCCAIRDILRDRLGSGPVAPPADDDTQAALDATVGGLLHAARSFPQSEMVQSAMLAALCEMAEGEPSLHDGRCGAAAGIGVTARLHFLPECKAAASAIAFRAADDGLELIAAAALRFPTAALLQRDAFVVACAVLDGLLLEHERDSAVSRLIKAGLPAAAVACLGRVTAIYEPVQPAAGEATVPGELYCCGGAWSVVRQALMALLGAFALGSGMPALNADFLQRAMAKPATVIALVRALRFEVAFWRAHLASVPGALAAGRLPDAAAEVAFNIMATVATLIEQSGPQRKVFQRHAFVQASGHLELLSVIDGLLTADASATELMALRAASCLFERSLRSLELAVGVDPLVQEGGRLSARVILMLQSRAPPEHGADASDGVRELDRLNALDAVLSLLCATSCAAHQPVWSSSLRDDRLAFRAVVACCDSVTCLRFGNVFVNAMSLVELLVGTAHFIERAQAENVRRAEAAAQIGITDTIWKAR